MQTLQSGHALQHGSYRIEKVLGQGGFGITYLATDVALQRKVAIKEFFPKDFCDRDDTTSNVTLGTKNTAEFVNRLKAKFLKEARNIAKFDHPNIIRIFAAFEENNTAYYVMEYIEGSSLSALVKAGGPLPRERALNYITRIGNALEYVHARKINHLDIKPANIMIRREDNTPILIDFGLSKQYDSEGNQTSTMPPGFSHGFAPMEQYNEGGVKDFSPQTDIYALAATLYYALSGVVPLQATRRNDEELSFPASIPQQLIAPISKAMSPGRKDRHPQVSEFLKALTPAGPAPEPDATNLPPSPGQQPEPPVRPAAPALEPEPDEPASSPSKSGKMPYVIAACVAVVAVIAGIFLLKPDSPAPSSAGEASESSATPSLTEVTDLPVMANDGSVIYTWTGPVNANNLPHGEGVARFAATDKLSRKEYRGTMLNGVCQSADATLLYTNGSTFEGSFKDGAMAEGTLSLPDDEVYFKGTFKNNKRYNGNVYDLNTNEHYFKVVNGIDKY